MAGGKRNGSNKGERTTEKSSAQVSPQTTPPQSPQNNNGDRTPILIPTTNLLQISSAPSGLQNPLPQPQNNNTETPSPPSARISDHPHASEILALVKDEENLQKLKDLQCTSIDIFHTLFDGENELWKRDRATGKDVLNVFEYKKQFEPLDPLYDNIVTWIREDRPASELPSILSNIPAHRGEVAVVPAPPFITEFSKETVIVSMDAHDLVTLFMDVKEWSDCFHELVSNVDVLETILEGENGPNDYDRALKLISAEFHLPSPLVETRKCYFLRSACQMLDCQSWVVVDVSLESIFPSLSGKYIKKPSGCFIETHDIKGYSLVTWIEHVEVDNTSVPKLFQPLVTSGYGFGAAGWVGALMHQVSRADCYYKNPEVIHGRGRPLMRLSERMMKSFILGISASSENKWKPMPIPGSEDILVRTEYNIDDVGSPRGLIVTVATTVLLQAGSWSVSEFLRDAGNRHTWDLLSFNQPTKEIMSVETDVLPRCSISIIPVLPASVPVMFNLQEVSAGNTSTYIVYTPVDMYDLHSVLQGRDPGNVQILSSGFAVMPDRQHQYWDPTSGTLLTFSFKIAVGENATASDVLPQNLVGTLHKVVTETVSLIKAAVGG